MSLTARLIERITLEGPMTVAQFMTACLHDPADGYYATRPALGEHGDFITAPMVSQMFGELIGVWAIHVWRGLGQPPRFRLIEVGPGDGTLMGDVLRAARLDPGFQMAMDVWLVETSEPLKEAQGWKLSGARPRWTDRLSEVPAGVPTILIANELLDCLPARQFVRVAAGWAERMVGSRDGTLVFGLRPAPSETFDGPLGAVLERSPAQEAFAAEVAVRLRTDGGAALLIDYGRADPGFGDTLQALQRHQKVEPLATAGVADLTVHADFPAVTAAARGEGVAVAISTQGDFLRQLGIIERAQTLADAQPDHAPVIERQLTRLIGPDQMGELFKVCCLYYPDTLPIPGFEEP
jgi:SAM-dependent MidA family methyltransferase